VLTAPEDRVAAWQLDFAAGDSLPHGALCHLHIGSDVDSLHVNIDPCVRDGVFAFDAHWSADDFDLSELPEWNLRTGGGRDDDLLEGLEVFAEIAVVSQVYGITFESLNRGRERHP